MIDESEPRLHGILVTFRRPEWVARTLVSLADQERRLDRLVIVDNAHGPDTESIARANAAATDRFECMAMAENRRFHGGVDAGSDTRSAERMTRTGSSFWTTTRREDPVPCEAGDLGADMADRDSLTACIGIESISLAQRLKNPDLSLH
jgi:glycosyltransferase involved in cell wall biosynthesis